MPTFRKKPVEIEAFQFQAPPISVPSWLADAMDAEDVRMFPDRVEIHTLEGVMRADVGDWIIQGVQGELYPCKPDIFAATYTDADAYDLRAE